MAEPSVAVIGSGPAGTACAMALVRRGVNVTMLDPGEELEAKRQSLVTRLGAMAKEDWSQSDIEEVRGFGDQEAAIPRKLVFGSDYPYAKAPPWAPIQGDSADIIHSHAFGGFSVAWGAAMLPVADCDLVDWPIGREKLDPHYRQVLSRMPLSARSDDLARHFPLFVANPKALRLEPQAEGLLRDLDRGLRRSPELADGLCYGQARLAVAVGSGSEETGCVYCGLCLSGCPYAHIYDCRIELRCLQREGALDYRPRRQVLRLEERGESVSVVFFETSSQRVERETFDRVFLGAGPIGSGRILLESLGWYDRTITVKDSQKFLLPFLRWEATPPAWPNMNSLADLFIEMKLPDLSDHWVHAQISAVHDGVLDRLRAMKPNSLRSRLFSPVIKRLMLAWCGLHSSHSGHIVLRLQRDGDGGSVLDVRKVLEPHTESAIRRAAWAFFRLGLRTRALFPAPLVVPYRSLGTHSGGSFPMRDSATDSPHSDLIGRPMGWERVHLVDASTFPSVPATTTLLTVMANADRIATTAPLS